MKLTALALSISFFAVACHKEGDRHCSQTPSKSGGSVRFIGYAPAEVDTLIVRRFARGSNFASLLSTQTVVKPGAFLYGDTVNADAERRPFFVVSDDADVEVEIPAAGRTHRVWDVTYGGDTATIHWEEENGCRQRPFNALAGAAIADGSSVQRGQYGLDIFLRK